MLAAALEAEVDAYIEAHTGECDEQGRRLVVRNGHAEPRSITTGFPSIQSLIWVNGCQSARWSRSRSSRVRVIAARFAPIGP